MEPLTASIIVILGKYALDKGLELGKEVGPKALETAKEMSTAVLDRLCKTPKGEVLAEGFQEDPQVYQKPFEKELEQEIAADPGFAAQLQALMGKFEEAAKEYAATTGRTYTATVRGSGAIAQDSGVAAGADGVAVGHDLTIHIVKNYLSGPAQLDDDAFRQALTRYLTWLDETCGWLTLRGIKQRDQQVLTLPLDEVYTSLSIEARESHTVDVGQLLLQGSRLVITGAPGSGKSTGTMAKI